MLPKGPNVDLVPCMVLKFLSRLAYVHNCRVQPYPEPRLRHKTRLLHLIFLIFAVEMCFIPWRLGVAGMMGKVGNSVTV